MKTEVHEITFCFRGHELRVAFTLYNEGYGEYDYELLSVQDEASGELIDLPRLEERKLIAQIRDQHRNTIKAAQDENY